LTTARMLFLALGMTGCFHLVVRVLGMRYLPGLWATLAPSANLWQLAFEPLLFFYLARLTLWIDQKIDKLLPTKKAALVMPFTGWRKRPMQDYHEMMQYSWDKLTRIFAFYRTEAEGVVRMVVDDVFNTVVFVRVLCIAFGLSAYLSFIFRWTGFGSTMDRHTSLFHDSTGFVRGDGDMTYLTDRLFSMGVSQTLAGVGYAGEVGSSSMGSTMHLIANVWAILWRLVVPMTFFFVVSKWQKLLLQQQKAFKKEWEGDAAMPWTTSKFSEMMQLYGSFWGTVKSAEEWNPVPPKCSPSLMRRRTRLSFSIEGH